MRRQSGTSSLRALVYMDEIAGYFPPVANPPAKAPLLTLLKQGRAFGDRRGARHAEHRRPRLQGAREHRHVVPRAPADRAGQGARARRARGGRRRIARSRGRGPDALGARQARVPAARRPRRRADHVPEPLGDVVPARAAVARADSGADAPRRAGPSSPRKHGRRIQPRKNTDEHGSRHTAAENASTSAPVLAPGVQQYFLPAAAANPHYTPVALGIARVTFARRQVEDQRDARSRRRRADRRRRGAGGLVAGGDPRHRAIRPRDGAGRGRDVRSRPEGGRRPRRTTPRGRRRSSPGWRDRRRSTCIATRA